MSLLFSTGAIAGSAAKGAPGMVLLTPTSIAHSGTSASIGANGQVTFTAVTSLSLNGVFSADFDNYVLNIRLTGNNPAQNIAFRLRVSGTDASGATDYTVQSIAADGSSVTSSRVSGASGIIADSYQAQRSGATAHIYGPFLAQPTAVRYVGASDFSSASVVDRATTHSLSTSYDGITLFRTSDNFTGALQVYGVRS